MAATRMAKENTCIQCGSTFNPWASNPSAMFCSIECRTVSRRIRLSIECETCRRSVEYRPHETTRKFCNRKCKAASDKARLIGQAAPWYKGGWVNQNGYRVISVDSKKYLEHRYVVEQHLGRPLTDEEAVHHIDGNKLNNVIDNLRVMSYTDHMKLHWSTGHYKHRREEKIHDTRNIQS